MFTITMLVGIFGCVALSIPNSWLAFLVVFVIAKVGYNASVIFYDSMLVDITTQERMDTVSSHGYAWGYIGSCIPFVISLIFVLMYEKLGITMQMGMTLAFCLNAVWWFVVTLPLLRSYKQKYYVELPKHPVRDSFGRLGKLWEILKRKHIFYICFPFLFY